MNGLGVVDVRVLNTLMDLADKDNIVNITVTKLAKEIGYKETGGAITYALKTLQLMGKIRCIAKQTYRVLV